MVVTDPIADLLTRIRNAIMARHLAVDIPFSKMKFEIVKIIKGEGFIKAYKCIEKDNKTTIKVYLKYTTQNSSVINGLRLISRPGRRVYVKKSKIPKVLGGVGIAVLSTPKGILDDKRCREQNVGGEVLCYIW